MGNGKTIGIVGGLGPYAGLDLLKKAMDQTVACGDQEHLSVVLVSEPSAVPSRLDFLLGRSKENPARSIVAILGKLEAAGASVAGIPCNSSHSPMILDQIKAGMARARMTLKLVDMPFEVVDFAIASAKTGKPLKAGILATTGTASTGVYQKAFGARGVETLQPSPETQRSLNDAIYDETYGIKAKSSPVTERAERSVLAAAEELLERGATALVLGCTELPLALRIKELRGAAVIDSTLALARALVREADASKLRPLA